MALVLTDAGHRISVSLRVSVRCLSSTLIIVIGVPKHLHHESSLENSKFNDHFVQDANMKDVCEDALATITVADTNAVLPNILKHSLAA